MSRKKPAPGEIRGGCRFPIGHAPKQVWCSLQASNLRPPTYRVGALPIELRELQTKKMLVPTPWNRTRDLLLTRELLLPLSYAGVPAAGFEPTASALRGRRSATELSRQQNG